MLLDDALYVETPEGVQLAAVLADPLSRAQALLLDVLIIAASLYVLAVLLSLVSAGLASQGIFTALAFVLVWGYFFLFEWLWRGVTPGKRALNLQVISADLMPLLVAQAAWRNVLRYLDWLPGFFGVGALALVLSPKNQRLGDWMAGTVVIFRRAPQMAVRPLQPGEVSPPGAHIDAWLGWLGFNSHSLDYVYQGATVAGAITLYHWLFSFAFAFVYVFCSVFWPRIRMWYGVLYGLIITVVMHGFLIPLLGFRNPVYAEGKVGWLWNLNGYELWSEILGHIYWSVSIEVCMIAVLAHYARPIRGDWVMR